MSSPNPPTNPASGPPGGSSGFTVGQPVRVRQGTVDPDYPDAVLGGWVGHIRDIDATNQPPTLLVAWTHETLAAMHPAYRVRCERDELEFDEMWLKESDLEPCPEGTLPSEVSPRLEAPLQLQPAPLDLAESADRVRAIFGLTSDDPLPPPEWEYLKHYRRHLQREIRFPFPALVPGRTGPEPVLVTRILPVQEDDPELVVEVAQGKEKDRIFLSMLESGPNESATQLIEDYTFWLEEAPAEESGAVYRRRFYPHLTRYSILTFGVAGALLATTEEARTAAWMAAAGFATIIGLWGCYIYRRGEPSEPGGLAGLPFVLCLGAVAGGLLGLALGPLVAAYLGTIPGAILGTVIGLMLGRRSLGEAKWTLLGALGGGMVLALTTNILWALAGFALGLVPGLVIGFILMVILFNTFVVSAPAEENKPRD